MAAQAAARVRGGEMIDWRTMRADEEIFTHWDDVTGKVTDLAASRIVAMCRDSGEEIWRTPLRQDHAALPRPPSEETLMRSFSGIG